MTNIISLRPKLLWAWGGGEVYQIKLHGLEHSLFFCSPVQHDQHNISSPQIAVGMGERKSGGERYTR